MAKRKTSRKKRSRIGKYGAGMRSIRKRARKTRGGRGRVAKRPAAKKLRRRLRL